MAHDVFLSYSSQDKSTADAVCAGLEAEGIRCWVAPRDIPPGSNYGAEINMALKNCAVFVLIFSKPAGDSVWVMKEVERAISYRKPVVPFRIDETLPGEGLEFYLASCHWLDALTSPLSKHIAVLARSVLAFVEPEAAAQAAERKRRLTGETPAKDPDPLPPVVPDDPPEPDIKPEPDVEPEPDSPPEEENKADPLPELEEKDDAIPSEPVGKFPLIRATLAAFLSAFFMGWAISMYILQIFFGKDMDDWVLGHFAIAGVWMTTVGVLTYLALKKWSALQDKLGRVKSQILVYGCLATMPAVILAFIVMPILFDGLQEKPMIQAFGSILVPVTVFALHMTQNQVRVWYRRDPVALADRLCLWYGWICALTFPISVANTLIFTRFSMKEPLAFSMVLVGTVICTAIVATILRRMIVRPSKVKAPR